MVPTIKLNFLLLVLLYSCNAENKSCLSDGKYRFNYEDKLIVHGDTSTFFQPCQPFHCYRNKVRQKGEERVQDAKSLEECSKYCCQTPACTCTGFDWSRDNHDCRLFDKPRGHFGLTDVEGFYSCEFKHISTEYDLNYQGFYFKLHNESADWMRAKDICVEEGGQLVNDDSLMKHEFLKKKFPGKNYWTGIRKVNIKDDEVLGYWAYTGDSDPRYQLSFWDEGQPNLNPIGQSDSDWGNCVVMWGSGFWHARSCLETREFICEIPSLTVEESFEREEWLIAMALLMFSLVIIPGFCFVALYRYQCHRHMAYLRSTSSSDFYPSEYSLASSTDSITPIRIMEPKDLRMHRSAVERGLVDPDLYLQDCAVQRDDGRAPPRYTARPDDKQSHSGDPPPAYESQRDLQEVREVYESV